MLALVEWLWRTGAGFEPRCFDLKAEARYLMPIRPGSSEVEQPPCKRPVGGSNPFPGSRCGLARVC